MTDPIIQNNSERLDDKDVVYSVFQRLIGHMVIVVFINKVVKKGFRSHFTERKTVLSLFTKNKISISFIWQDHASLFSLFFLCWRSRTPLDALRPLRLKIDIGVAKTRVRVSEGEGGGEFKDRVKAVWKHVMSCLDLLTSRAFEREARSYERGARASERAQSANEPGPTTPDQKPKRTTLRKSKGDVTRDDSQRRFSAQHSVTTLLRHCFEWLQHCCSIATMSCAKNRCCESSGVTSP